MTEYDARMRKKQKEESFMKKLRKVVLLLLTLCLSIPVHTVNVQAATVEKTSIMSAKQVGKNPPSLCGTRLTVLRAMRLHTG